MEVFRAQGADGMAVRDARMSTRFPESASVSEQSHADAQGSVSRDQRVRELAFLCLSESCSPSFVGSVTAKEWKKLLHWLDVSGLALYFLDRMDQTGQRESLPAAVVDRLEQSQRENRQRTRGMIDEAVRLQRDFQSANLSYAVMKGVSLCPVPVPRLELRHQFDLDFLIREGDAPAARDILERHGYVLLAVSGKSWEFKKGQTPRVTAKDLYRDLPYRGVELHLEMNAPGVPARLEHAVVREMYGMKMPALSPADIFLGQAMHASKDISSPFFRASHLLEFYRHVLARYGEDSFWEEVRLRACDDERARLAIGMVTYLLTSVWGSFAPEALTSWTVNRLPAAIKLWLDLYGRSAIFQVPPGTKRYLRLRQELERATGASRGSSKSSLFSFGFPNVVIQATPGETLSTRVARYRVQIRFLISRAYFHCAEGLRFAAESRRWRRLRSHLP